MTGRRVGVPGHEGAGVRLRVAVACAAFLAALFTPLGPAASGQVACAAEEGPRAALVVDTGGNVYRLCVRLDATRVSGLHLIELASSQYGLTYRFGEGGQAVCMLANVGATGDDCFGEHPYFWGFWVGDGSGGWSWSGSGAGSVSVGEGGTHGWSWDTGDGPSTHRPPPRTTHRSVCPAPEKPDPSRPPSTRGPVEGGGAGSAGEGAPGSSDPASAQPSGDGTRAGDRSYGSRPGQRAGSKEKEEKASRRRDGEKERERDPAASSPAPSASSSGVAGAGPPLPKAPGGSGPPPAGVAALGASAALVGAGVLLARKRRSSAG